MDISMAAIKHEWEEYLQQPVLPASIAYVLLCFNVVLAPGGLMTAFLTQHGLSPSLIGGFSCLCAFMDVGATFMSAQMAKQLGILKAGAAGLILQAAFLTVAVGVYWSGALSKQTALLFFLGFIVTPPTSITNVVENKTAPKLQKKRKFVSRDSVLKQAKANLKS